MTNITHIIDYQGIQPINKTDATTFTIPNSPNKAILVNIELKIPLKYSHNNRIELITTIGFKSVTNDHNYLLEFSVTTLIFLTHK